jgi:hypothetical protein
MGLCVTWSPAVNDAFIACSDQFIAETVTWVVVSCQKTVMVVFCLDNRQYNATPANISQFVPTTIP